MAERADVTVDWGLSPRLIEVALPSVELSNQDMHDTLNSNTLQAGMADDSLDNMDDDPIIDSAGKEDLGGGVEVGITSTLLDGQVAFGRTAPRSTTTDTITSAGTTTVTAAAATFQSDGVVRGDWVVNWTDQSVSEVLAVLSETQLRVRTPSGVAAATDDYAVNDVISVWEVSECELSGGNTVAVDAVPVSINPLFTTFGRFATRAAASQATTQNQEAIEAAAFNGGVAFDPSSSNVGTAFPNGTREFPCKNISDVHAISTNRGLRTIFVMSDAVLTDTIDISVHRHFWIGDSRDIIVDIPATMNVANSSFERCTVSGDLGGGNTLKECDIGMATFNGHVDRSAFTATVTITGASEIENSVSHFPGDGHPEFILGSNVIQVRNWHGSFSITSMSGGTHTIEIYGGRLHLHAGCTGGTVHQRGQPHDFPLDESVGTTLIDQAVSTKAIELWQRLGLDPNNPLTTNDDNTITVGNITIGAVNGPTSTVQTRT
jgi:hypothetical protein